jgi:hypothetical protein
VRNFSYIAYYDSWDGAHPQVFSPKHRRYVEFESSEEINNYLLRNAEVRAFIASHGGRPKVAMVFFDEETERICEELGCELILPSHELRRRLDSKIVTTVLGNEASAPSVPKRARGGGLLGPPWSGSPPTRGSAPTSSCRPRTATPARRRSS